jgi:broad specificity phosphatase PhoE
LREYHVGILEGQTHSQETEDLYWQAKMQWVRHGNFDARIEGGESSQDIAARFMPMIAELEAQYRDTEATLLLISHGGTLGAMLPLLLSNLDQAYPIEHPMGYTNPIVAELRDGEWVCMRWGEETMMD